MNTRNLPLPLSIKFTVPAFRHKGTEYLSADVAKAASEGEEAALSLIGELVKMGSGIVAPEEPKKGGVDYE